MKDNELTIVINKPIEEVFNFTLNPANTPIWFPSIQIEETNEWPVKIGTIYRNKGLDGIWNEYKLVDLVENNTFTLTNNIDGNYSVKYSFKKLSDNTIEFEYHEWMRYGDLSEPLTFDVLENLKSILEG